MSETLFKHLRAIMMPFTMTVIVPLLIVSGTGIQAGWGLPSPFQVMAMVLGIGLIGGGLALVVMTIRLFVTVGKSTLAPWDPTQRLVVVGIYRYVRNPMISGVFNIILGEAVLFGSAPVLVWALLFIGANMIYMPLSEEPGLMRRFGADYEEYARHVPRWLPRRTPWSPHSQAS